VACSWGASAGYFEAFLGGLVGEGDAEQVAPLVIRRYFDHQHHFLLLLARERSGKPRQIDQLCTNTTNWCLTWIKFLPSALVTRGWSFGVVKV
jgi:hypothetical protein